MADIALHLVHHVDLCREVQRAVGDQVLVVVRAGSEREEGHKLTLVIQGDRNMCAGFMYKEGEKARDT